MASCANAWPRAVQIPAESSTRAAWPQWELVATVGIDHVVGRPGQIAHYKNYALFLNGLKCFVAYSEKIYRISQPEIFYNFFAVEADSEEEAIELFKAGDFEFLDQADFTDPYDEPEVIDSYEIED